jgi:hypothetical protein
MIRKLFLIGCVLLAISNYSFEQIVVKSIQSFGAKGDGKTNDTQAFEQAATFFNTRGGNGILLINKGIYIVGQQSFSNGAKGSPAYTTNEILHFKNVKNMVVKGETGAVIKFADSLRFGAFDPTTGQPYNHGNNRFTVLNYAVKIARCIYLENCDNIEVSNLEINGNNQALIMGGVFGDIGFQLDDDGVFIQNSHNINIDMVNASYFGRDGIAVDNAPTGQQDSITISNSVFQYNFRQGFSWVGGNGLIVTNCNFDHTGKGAYHSSPAAGMDIEGEAGPVVNGIFKNCTFIDNEGCGMVADSRRDSACQFINCTFWGTSNWSAWVTTPAFSFLNCNFYGAFVHGYNAQNDQDATHFVKCYFEDKLYNGNPSYGKFLIDTNGASKLTLDGCTLVANTMKLAWMEIDNATADKNYNVFNCHFIVMNAGYPTKDFVAVMRGVNYKNNTLEFRNAAAKTNGYWLDNCCSKTNLVDLGGNKVIYP